MIKAKSIVGIAQTREIISYDPETGLFTWKKNLKGPAKQGMVAGAAHREGYITIGLNGQSYLAHRLAWAFVYGDPGEDMQIDHINGDRSDNRICNLRIANHAENCRNSKVRKHSKTGIKGVKKRGNKWHVRIRIGGEDKWLGSYYTPEEASAAYKKAADELFGSFAKE